jgi:hypothetical protein
VRVRGRLKVYFGENSTIVRSLAGQTLPGLSGNVVTTLKTGARADLLATGRREARDPALAEWQLGSGRAVAWTPGVGKPWAPSWTQEEALFDDALRWAQRGVTPNPLTPQVPADALGTLQIDLASAGQPAAGVTLVRGTLTGPGGTHQVQFEPDGPGLFSANVASLSAGVYRFSLSAQGDRSLHAAGSVALAYPAEASPNTAYASPLGQVVAQSGGRVLKPGDPGALSFTEHSLRELFVLLALIAFLAGVVVRLAPGVRTLARRTAA